MSSTPTSPLESLRDPADEPLRFERAGRTTLVYRSGISGGANFVLIHGIGMGRAYWSRLAHRLERAGTVYTLELPGFGDAPEPEEALSIPETGALVGELIRELGIGNPVLIGHSMGTQVAVETAAALGDEIPELVLLAPTITDSERSLGWQGLRLIQDMITPQPLVAAYGAYYYLKAGMVWYFKKLKTMLEHEPEAALPRITAHTLVLRGERDRVVPRRWAQSVAAKIPNARYTEVPGHGHETMVVGADAVALAILDHARIVRPS